MFNKKLKQQIASMQEEINRLRWGVENPRKFRNGQVVETTYNGSKTTMTVKFGTIEYSDGDFGWRYDLVAKPLKGPLQICCKDQHEISAYLRTKKPTTVKNRK